MELQPIKGEGTLGITISLSTEEQMQIAEWIDNLEQLSHPRIKSFDVKFNIGHEETPDNYDDRSTEKHRLDELLVDTINPVSGVTAFLRNLTQGLKSYQGVINELTARKEL